MWGPFFCKRFDVLPEDQPCQPSRALPRQHTLLHPGFNAELWQKEAGNLRAECSLSSRHLSARRVPLAQERLHHGDKCHSEDTERVAI